MSEAIDRNTDALRDLAAAVLLTEPGNGCDGPCCAGRIVRNRPTVPNH